MLTAGCKLDVSGLSTGQDVESRAKARWAALIKRDFQAAYAYTTPGFREVTPERVYATSFGNGVVWKSIELDKTECESERCKIHLTLNYSIQSVAGLPHPVDLKDVLVETWIKREGEWWFVPPLR